MLYSENLGDFLLSITDKTGKIIQVNEKFCDVSKYSENEILGKTHKILKSGHHPDSFYKNLWMTISKGRPFSCLIKNKAKDGKTYWLKSIMIPILDENSNPSQYVCVSYKVIIQNEADKIRLKFTNNIADVLNESATVVITDKTGTITYVNKRFCELCKYPIEELLGRNTRILKSGYHSQEFYETLWSTISNGKIWRGDLKNKAADGTFYWVRTTIVPIFDENKNIKNYISIRTDITSQVKLSEKLVKAERLSSIGELASRMSHDIRNPLSIIAVSLENLKILYGINDLKQKQFDKIGRSIDRIVHQIDDVLDFVKIQPTEMSKIKISKVIADSLDSIYIPNNILLKLPKNDIELFCNEKQFSIALNNLILNGIQAIDGKGTVEITVEENDDSVIIQVKDSGKGIPEKDLDKIFEPLFTTKQQGTGLGLSSVKSIVESHGGIISVTSSPTVFTITLPKINDN